MLIASDSAALSSVSSDLVRERVLWRYLSGTSFQCYPFPTVYQANPECLLIRDFVLRLG